MMMKSLSFSAAMLLLATAAYAKVPSTTDEARAVAPAVPGGRVVPSPSVVPIVVTSTDEARALALKQRAAETPIAVPASSRAVSSTDEARAASGGVKQKQHGGGG